MPPRRVTLGFWGLCALFTLPLMIMDTARMYDTAIAEPATFGDAALRALASFFGLGLAFGIMWGMLFLAVAYITSVVIPDTVSAVQSIRAAARRAPAAWQRFRDNVARARSRLRQGLVACLRFLGQIPVRVRAMGAQEWLFGLFVLLSLATLAGMLYLGWGWAGAVVAWLPHWLVDGKDWVIQLIVDWLICMLPFSITTSILSGLIKALVRRIRRR